MDMQLYALHVIPFILLVYFAFLLFLHPPRAVLLASLLGGLIVGVINALVDLLAYYASWWHYTATGLILHLPLPFYLTPILVYGAIVYLLIWRFWNGRFRWFALLLLIAVPLFAALRDFYGAAIARSTYLTWDTPLAWLLDLVMWLVMFYAGFLAFRWVVPLTHLDTPS
jgi:hypothetical protein